MPLGMKCSESCFNPISLNAAGTPYLSKICLNTVDYHSPLKTRTSRKHWTHISQDTFLP